MSTRFRNCFQTCSPDSGRGELILVRRLCQPVIFIKSSLLAETAYIVVLLSGHLVGVLVNSIRSVILTKSTHLKEYRNRFPNKVEKFLAEVNFSFNQVFITRVSKVFKQYCKNPSELNLPLNSVLSLKLHLLIQMLFRI